MADLGPDELSSAELRIQLMGQFQVSRGPGKTPLRLPRVAAALPVELREVFVTKGRLAGLLAVRA